GGESPKSPQIPQIHLGTPKFHLYRENPGSHQFEEQPVQLLFPELQDVPSNVLWLDVQPVPGSGHRLSALGCQSGFVRVARVDQDSRAVLQSWSVQLDGPISTVLLFPAAPGAPTDPEDRWSLLVSSALEAAVVYRRILRRGLAEPLELRGAPAPTPSSAPKSPTSTSTAAAEILLGTYGQELLCYKYFGAIPAGPANSGRSGARRFPSPLLALEPLDLTGDGLREIAVVCLGGLHVLQPGADGAAAPGAAPAGAGKPGKGAGKTGKRAEKREKELEKREEAEEEREEAEEERGAGPRPPQPPGIPIKSFPKARLECPGIPGNPRAGFGGARGSFGVPERFLGRNLGSRGGTGGVRRGFGEVAKEEPEPPPHPKPPRIQT
ncbi:KICSTOR complex protein kaptin-like, partial [Cyanocitta cristata]